MRKAKLEPYLISYNAGISACEKGEQWQRALTLLSEMREAKLEPNVISYSAGISACEKGEQWQRALALLSELREAKIKPNVISYDAGISACEKGKQWQRALDLLSEMREAKLEPNVISYNAGTSAGEKGEQWQLALALLSEMREAKLEPDVISYSAGISACEKVSYSAGISACEKGEQWQPALALLSEMREVKFEPNVSAVINACETGEQWQPALALLNEMWEVRADQQAEDPGAVIDGYSCIERTTLHGEQECLSCPEQAPSRQSCADACDKRASCNTFVFGGGQCWLKANASTLVAFPGDEASCFKVGPFHKIGSGLCVDADGQHYRSARRSGYRVPWSCSLACEELGSNVCRGYSFFPLPGNAGMCVLAMDQFEHPDPHWVMDPRVGHHGAGPVARSTGRLPRPRPPSFGPTPPPGPRRAPLWRPRSRASQWGRSRTSALRPRGALPSLRRQLQTPQRAEPSRRLPRPRPPSFGPTPPPGPRRAPLWRPRSRASQWGRSRTSALRPRGALPSLRRQLQTPQRAEPSRRLPRPRPPSFSPTPPPGASRAPLWRPRSRASQWGRSRPPAPRPRGALPSLRRQPQTPRRAEPPRRHPPHPLQNRHQRLRRHRLQSIRQGLPQRLRWHPPHPLQNLHQRRR
ncbi:unnamed protein product, partial [Prorocentrum cordatum]